MEDDVLFLFFVFDIHSFRSAIFEEWCCGKLDMFRLTAARAFSSRTSLRRFGKAACFGVESLSLTFSVRECAFSTSTHIQNDGKTLLEQLLAHVRQAASEGPVQVARVAKLLPDDLLEQLPGGVLKFCKAHPSVLQVVDVGGISFVEAKNSDMGEVSTETPSQVADKSCPPAPIPRAKDLWSIPPPPPPPPQSSECVRKKDVDDHLEESVVVRSLLTTSVHGLMPSTDFIRKNGMEMFMLLQHIPSRLVDLDELAQIPSPSRSAFHPRKFWKDIVMKAREFVTVIAVPRAQMNNFTQIMKLMPIPDEASSTLLHQNGPEHREPSMALTQAAGQPEGAATEQPSEYDVVFSADDLRATAKLDENFCLELIDDVSVIDGRLDEFVVFVSLLPQYAQVVSKSLIDEKCAEHSLFSKEYDAFRAARFLSLTRFTPLLHMAYRVRSVITSVEKLPLLLLSFPQLFSTDSPKKLGGIMFHLNESFIPQQARTRSFTELRELSSSYREQWKALSSRENQLRVKLKNAEESHRRAMHIQIRPSVFCDTSVLAYYIFDLLGDAPLNTGLLPTLLPEHIRLVTNSKSKKFITSFPHLFRIFEDPPEYMIQRADLPFTPIVDPLCSDDELNNIVLSAVSARLQAHKSKILLPSHITKYLPKAIRKRILKSDGDFETFLRNRPQLFTLTDGIHKVEPAIQLSRPSDPCVA